MSLSPPTPPTPPIPLHRRHERPWTARAAAESPVAVPRVVASAANDADFKAGDLDHTVLRFRDLHLAPTPLFFAMLACAVPLLMLGMAVRSWESMAVGAVLLVGALGCLWHGIQTLRGLRLRCGSPLPCFPGDQVMVALDVANPAGRSRWDVAVTLGLTAPPGGNGWIDLAPHSRRQVLMPLVVTGRGRQSLPLIRLETQHPFGLVGVSAYWAPRVSLLIVERLLPCGGTAVFPTSWTSTSAAIARRD